MGTEAQETEQGKVETPEERYDAQLKREASELAKGVGLTIEESPELKDAYIAFLTGRTQDGLAEVQRVTNETEKKVALDYAEKHGVNLGYAETKVKEEMSWRQASDLYRKGEISHEEYRQQMIKHNKF